ncbi:iron chaperone [Rathayibacter soli]|uniref:iron chaperone n=1 Tax=Rathayibacter soli TaxID=3144168 RepID=UPI0027E3DF8E|nr:DUF1801 domain-containing protein [Glaciibacter superstes]
MGAVSEYLETVEGPDREALERVYSIARDVAPEAEEGISYAMAALLYRGKGLIATLRAKNFLSLYPFSGVVVSAVADDLPGFEVTSGSIHYSAQRQLPDAVLRRIITLRRAEIEEKSVRRTR